MPMDTDAVDKQQRKRRRVGNHVYIGSTDLGYRRDHMEVTYVAHTVLLRQVHL